MKYEILAQNARFFTISAAILTLAFAFYFYKWMRKQDEGTDKMKEIASHVRSGAIAYLKQQYRVIAFFFAGAFIVFAILSYALKVQNPFIPIGFLTGGFFSTLSGFLGMKTATYASARTANAASKSLNQGLTIAFRSGAVMGLTVVGLALFDISMWFIILNAWLDNSWFNTDFLALGNIARDSSEFISAKMHFVTTTMLSFGVGASFQALFARVGGGIFTKAADVGADLVGKVEAGIPEDDPRNPAVIADNVGDNVGDVDGSGALRYPGGELGSGYHVVGKRLDGQDARQVLDGRRAQVDVGKHVVDAGLRAVVDVVHLDDQSRRVGIDSFYLERRNERRDEVVLHRLRNGITCRRERKRTFLAEHQTAAGFVPFHADHLILIVYTAVHSGFVELRRNTLQLVDYQQMTAKQGGGHLKIIIVVFLMYGKHAGSGLTTFCEFFVVSFTFFLVFFCRFLLFLKPAQTFCSGDGCIGRACFAAQQYACNGRGHYFYTHSH